MVQRVERKYGKKRKPPSLSPPALVLLSSKTKEDMGRGFLDKERGSVSGEKKEKRESFQGEGERNICFKAAPLTR